MNKYHLDLKMKMVFWFMRHSPQPCEDNYIEIRERPNSVPKFLFRNFEVAEIENRTIPGRAGEIPVRIYRPSQAINLPMIVYYHGGGFVIGSLDSCDPICRRLAAENKAVVVSVDYRLAPEHRFPAPADDAYDATLWASEHAAEIGADTNKLIVMGDSAGGNLAAVVSQQARDRGGPAVAFQVLIYPAVDFSGDYPSLVEYADNPVLPAKTMDFFHSHYVSCAEDNQNPCACPALAQDFSGLPPALVLTAEYDPLRDEGKHYADCLQQAGVEATCFCAPGMPHGYFSMGRLASGTETAFGQIKQSLSRFTTEAQANQG